MAFLNPLFLIGAAAAAIPILVHLVRRTKARRIQFASLMFLRRIEQKTIRRRKLRNILLLALRCLAFLLLALAFARPYFPGRAGLAAAAERSSSVILLDVSYSMRYPGVFERARKEARSIINAASESDPIALALFSTDFELVRPIKPGRAEALALLDQSEAGLGATDYLQAIQAADSILKDEAVTRKRIHVISDFHEAGWNRALPQVRLSKNVELFPVDVGDRKAVNLAVTEVKSEPTIYTQKYAGKVVARLSYSGATPSEATDPVDAVAELKLNDLVVERRPIRLDGVLQKTLEFTGFNVPEGSNRAAIDVTGDGFTFDNRFSFTINRRPQIKVLAIETAARGRSESFFLQQALLAGETNPYGLTIKTVGSVNPSELESYRAIVINDAAALPQGLIASIKQFVERGGGLIIAAARHTEAGEFNNAMQQIAPAALGEVVQARGGYALTSQIRTEHPIFSPFASSGRLAAIRVYSYHRATPGDRASVIAALDDGTPLLIEGKVGMGKALMLTSTLDTSWNDLPLSPMFLPLMRQMLDYLGGRQDAAARTVGQLITAPLDRDATMPSVEKPSGGRYDDAQKTGQGEISFPARETGFYRLKYRDSIEYIAVNLDMREADLSRLNIDDLVASISPENKESAERAAAGGQLTSQEIEARQRIWLPLLISALIVFVAESLISRRIKIAKILG